MASEQHRDDPDLGVAVSWLTLGAIVTGIALGAWLYILKRQ